jgi:ankyrin repeat protein
MALLLETSPSEGNIPLQNLLHPADGSVLHFIAHSSDTKALDLILKHTRTNDMVVLLVNVMDRVGRTPLHIAAHRGSLKMVEALLAAGADRNIRTEYGQTPLSLAHSREDFNLGIVKALGDVALEDTQEERLGVTEQRGESSFFAPTSE